MNIEDLRASCISKAGTEECFPFGEGTLVFKVMGKIFALLPLDSERLSINLKCDPEWAIELREFHPEVQPGYHMNKKHWNTVYPGSGLENKMVIKMIQHSYDLVAASLPKSKRELLEKMKKS